MKTEYNFFKNLVLEAKGMALISLADIRLGVSRVALAHNIVSDCHQLEGHMG